MDKKILITCARLVDLAGSEITTLELAEAFKKMGWQVFVAAFELRGDIQQIVSNLGIQYVDLSNEHAITEPTMFDIAWLHHNVAAYRVFLDRSISMRKVIFSSLSYFEPIEAPPISAFPVSRYLVNSEENLSHFVSNYPDFQSKAAVFHNSAPKQFWYAGEAQRRPALCRLAVVSNHIPGEVRQLVQQLATLQIAVDIFGVSGRRERVTPERLRAYDAVITIGKTVQYCLAGKIPVYCYDHFGGNGWLTIESFDRERFYNFSGRGSRGRVDVTTLLAEVVDGYANAVSEIDALHALGTRYFLLEANIKEILANLESDYLGARLSDTDQHIILRQNTAYKQHQNMLAHHSKLLSKKDAQISNSKKILSDRNAQLLSLSKSLDELAALQSQTAGELVAIKNSNSWRLTEPLRWARRQLNYLSEKLKQNRQKIEYLYSRSRIVLERQGVLAFLKRTFKYINTFLLNTRVNSSIDTFVQTISKSTEPVLVSFVIPIYDRTDVLRTAINSALNQTISNIEVILVTDGSPKATIDVVNEFVHHPKVKIFHYPCSSGNAVRGRNKGISEARGRYIAFLDSDDIALPDRLEHSLGLLENGKADVVYGSWRALMDGTRNIPGIIDGQLCVSPDADLEMLLEACIPCQSTVIVRKSLFERTGLLKPSMQYREDHELWARLAFYGGVFKSVPHVLTKLRLHSGNNELNFKEGDAHWEKVLQNEYKHRGPNPKKIAFILPGVGISGGIAVVFKHAAMLMDAGHDAFVINVGEMGDGNWFGENPVPVVHVSDSRFYLFQGIDLLIATGWSTAEWLDRIPSRRKLYFVQSDERRFYEEEALKQKIHATYLIHCEYFTEARWIQKMLWEEFAHEAAYVPNGLDTKLFFPDTALTPKTLGKLRVLIEGPIVIPFKGMADSYAALEGLECEIWIVSSAGHPPKEWKYDRFFEGVPFGEMRKLYSSCDIFLKMSRIEGFFGPPMEAMACGCSVVVGKVAGYDEYIVDEYNALVVEQGDVAGARVAVQRLLEDAALRQQLIKGGKETVLNWGWERSAQAMLNVVNHAQSDHLQPVSAYKEYEHAPLMSET